MARKTTHKVSLGTISNGTLRKLWQTNKEGSTMLRIATYYSGDDTTVPDEVINVDSDIAPGYIASTAKMLRRDNKRHGLTDRIAEVDCDGVFVRWLS